MPTLNLNTPKRSWDAGKNIVIIILILIIICLGCYLITVQSSKSSKKVIVKTTKVSNVTNLDITSKEVTDLYNSVDVFHNFDLFDNSFKDKYLGYLYKLDKLNVKEFSSDIILMIALANIDETKFTKDNKISIPKSEVDTITKKIFGEVEYTHSADIPRIKGGTYVYDEKAMVYNANINNFVNVYPLRHCITQIVKAEKTKEEITIDVKILYEFIESQEKPTPVYYADLNSQQKLETTNMNKEQIYTTYTEKLPSYKITYKNEEGVYHFKKVEKIS